jgi:predicted protein tyrosine phosphatase
MIFVMEHAHQTRLAKRFSAKVKTKGIICLDIPDKYAYMQQELIAILEQKAGRYFRHV